MVPREAMMGEELVQQSGSPHWSLFVKDDDDARDSSGSRGEKRSHVTPDPEAAADSRLLDEDPDGKYNMLTEDAMVEHHRSLVHSETTQDHGQH